jgi:hypothetical protein
VTLLAVAIAALFAYLAVGVLTIVWYDRATDGSVDDWDTAIDVLTQWPIIVFVAVVGAAALRAARGEA